MKNLSVFLEKFSRILNRGAVEKEVVLQVIKDETGLTLDSENIHINRSILEITTSPVVKNEISLKEAEIIRGLQNSRKLFLTRILYK